MLAAAIAAALVGFGALILLHGRSRSPEALLAKLAAGKGDRQDLIMRLNVARGDVVGPMLEALHDASADPTFRADVLELLLKRNFRAREERIEKALLAATRDDELLVRRKAVHGLSVYAEESLQVALIPSVSDPDPETRRHAYMVFAASTWHQDPEQGVWRLFAPAQKARLIDACLAQMKTEQDPQMQALARSVIGREIEIRGEKAKQALQASDVLQAEEILRGALKLDPEHPQAQIRLARFLLRHGDREDALRMARRYGAFFEVPRLSQPPQIDGDPTDAVWAEARTTDKFYQNTSRWIPQLAAGRSKACIGHRDGKIYIAVLGYEEDLTQLVQKHKSRDTDVWRDDCVEIIFDPANTERDMYQFVINPAGALFDQANRDTKKNFKCQYEAAIFPDRGYWACEFALDGRDLDNHPIRPGAMWSLNLFRTRIGGGSEQGAMWPTFGFSQRMDLYPIAVFK